MVNGSWRETCRYLACKMANSDKNKNEELSPEQFAGKLTQLVDHAALSMALGVGDSLGLFKVMAELKKPETSEVIAKKAGMVERYIREWLAILVTGKVVHFNREDCTYFLPRNYVSFLAPGKTNLALFSNLLLMFGKNYEELTQCFKNGGGISYQSFKKFHRWMNEFSTSRHEADLMSLFLPSIEGMREKLEKGIKVLDIGCGSGSPSLIMAAAFPKSEFYGFDISEEAITKAKAEVEKRQLKNCHFKLQDCSDLGSEFNDYFHYITAFDTIHDQAYPDKVLAETCKVLKKGGLFSLVDINAHSNVADNIGESFLPLKYTASLFHCMPVSLYFEGGKGLGTCWGKELAVEMLDKAGFISCEVRMVGDDTYNLHILCSK